MRLRAPVPPPESASASEPNPDFIEFLCGRFQVEPERGLSLLATLLDHYVPSEPFPIHTLDIRASRNSEG